MEGSLLVTIAAFLFTIWLLKWTIWGDGKKRPPGPWNLPVVGYIPFLSRLLHLDLQKLANIYGNIYSIRMGSQYVVVLNDFESTKEAFAQDAFVGRPPDSPFEFNKETIETEAFSGLPWKDQRRFSLSMLRDLGLGKSKMEAYIQEEISELLEHYEQTANKSITLRYLLTPSMSNNISSLMFGKRLKYGDRVRIMLTDVLNQTSEALEQVMWQFFFSSLKNLMRVLGIGDVDRLKRIGRQLRDYTNEEIKEHEATLDPNNIRDFIDGYLLETQKRKNDPAFCKEVLQDIVGAFFIAGSETVRLTVEWLILTAAAHQKSQDRVQAEIDNVVGRNRFPEGPDQKSMPFTVAFIMELMRWRTIIPINILRYTLIDSELKGYFIPKHSYVLSNLWAIHNNKEYWGSDVDEFRPERFLTDDGKTVKHWDHWIPFSIGKRQCPGEPLAKIEIFLYFTSILQRFNIRLPDGKTADFEGQLGIGFAPKLQDLIMTRRN